MEAAAAAIRPAGAADAAAVAGIYAAYVLETAATFELVPPGAAEMLQRMTGARLPWYVATRDGAVTGFSYAAPFRQRPAYRWSVECSVYLGPDERGRGTGRALYDVLLAELRRLGYVSAYAGIALPNDASVGLHEAVGFRPVGVFRDVGFKHGRWRDVGWWQLRLADPPPDPAEPGHWPG